MSKIATILHTLLFCATLLHAERIKDIANIVGVRDNQLIGYGLIVGLNGTGDKTSSKFTMQSIANMLESVNVKIDANDISSKNVAAVMVTAKLPPFSRQGDRIDVLVSSIGDAKSLEGGTLILTPLTGVDGRIYATSQGSITIGGKGGKGGGGNHPLVASVFGGAIIEREIPLDLYSKTTATLSLKSSNFQNAARVQKSLNESFGIEVARAIDPRTIKIQRPENMSMVEFLARVEEVEIDYSRENKIVIDERTGTIVAGVGVKVGAVVVTHGEITLKITPEAMSDSQAAELGGGMKLSASTNTLSSEGKAPTVAAIAKALQKMGAAPKDVIAILEAIKRSGAISADLEII